MVERVPKKFLTEKERVLAREPFKHVYAAQVEQMEAEMKKAAEKDQSRQNAEGAPQITEAAVEATPKKKESEGILSAARRRTMELGMLLGRMRK